MKLDNIRKGILHNLAVKNRHTLEVSKSIEGNSYFGQCIFVGISRMFDFSVEEISDYLSLDIESVEFHDQKFRSLLDIYFNQQDPGDTIKNFHTKTSLILNHIKLNYGKVVSLGEIIKDNIK